jgi:hypothetical protein
MINILSCILIHILAIVLYFLFDLLDSTPSSLHSNTTSSTIPDIMRHFFFLIYLLSLQSVLLSLMYVSPIIISYFHIFLSLFYQLYLFSLIVFSQPFLSFSSHHYPLILSFFSSYILLFFYIHYPVLLLSLLLLLFITALFFYIIFSFTLAFAHIILTLFFYRDLCRYLV